jgi:hypothetical protein
VAEEGADWIAILPQIALLATYSLHCIEQTLALWQPIWVVSPRRLEDRIRDLCVRAGAAQGDTLNAILSELKAALKEHTRRLRALAVDSLVARRKPARRQTD